MRSMTRSLKLALFEEWLGDPAIRRPDNYRGERHLLEWREDKSKEFRLLVLCTMMMLISSCLLIHSVLSMPTQDLISLSV
ncbi:unnamed protein product [Musa hybrid cultivar]